LDIERLTPFPVSSSFDVILALLILTRKRAYNDRDAEKSCPAPVSVRDGIDYDYESLMKPSASSAKG
jgi:hypothetical protein